MVVVVLVVFGPAAAASFVERAAATRRPPPNCWARAPALPCRWGPASSGHVQRRGTSGSVGTQNRSNRSLRGPRLASQPRRRSARLLGQHDAHAAGEGRPKRANVGERSRQMWQIVGELMNEFRDSEQNAGHAIRSRASRRLKNVETRSLRPYPGFKLECPVPLTVRGTQALVSFAPLAFKLFYAARQNAVLRRSPFPSP